jgi:1,2-dihydroxy-3-keto-5-methylthiopentene dioxygenase
MTVLQIMPDDEPDTVSLRTDDIERITAELAALGIVLDRVPADLDVTDHADQDAVLAAHRTQIDRISTEGGYRRVDLARQVPDDTDPEWPARARAARATFRDEHTHDKDEVRFVVSGTACFYLHVEHKVYAVVCEAGDLLSVPGGTTHWFDMGERPHYATIRFFPDESGWAGEYTRDDIAGRFPSLDALLAG